MKKRNKHDVFNSLYIYGNEQKVDDLLGKIYFSVISQLEVQISKEKSFGGNFKGGLNKIFHKFGLPEIEAEFNGNIKHENIKAVVSSITFDFKVDMLISYFKKNGRYPYIDLLNGDYYEYENNKKIISEQYFEGYMVGCVIGKFAAKRIYPPAESAIQLFHEVSIFEESRAVGDVKKSVTATVLNDFTDKRYNLWDLYTVKSNMIQGEIPILIGNIRSVSQLGLLKLYQQSEYLIEAIGVLNWENGRLMCDPIAFKLL